MAFKDRVNEYIASMFNMLYQLSDWDVTHEIGITEGEKDIFSIKGMTDRMAEDWKSQEMGAHLPPIGERFPMAEDKLEDFKDWKLEDSYVPEKAEDYKLMKDDRLNLYVLARLMTAGNLAHLLDDWLNLGGKDWRQGYEVGLILRSTHRTLQRLIICFCVGIICGLSRQRSTDARNEHAIEYAKRMYKDMKAGRINLGSYI